MQKSEFTRGADDGPAALVQKSGFARGADDGPAALVQKSGFARGADDGPAALVQKSEFTRGAGAKAPEAARAALHVEPEVHDVAVLDDVVLALDA